MVTSLLYGNAATAFPYAYGALNRFGNMVRVARALPSLARYRTT
jgi:hypothetical protein